VVTGLAVGALHGRHQRQHGRYWMTRSNGGFTFFHWGGAAITGALFLAVFMLATSSWFARLEWLFPVRGRWLRYLAVGVLALLWGLFVLLLVSQPIA